MKRVFGQILLCVSAVVALAGCDENLQAQSNGDSAHVLVYAPQKNGQYGLETVELLGISDLKSMSGQYVRFHVSPAVVRVNGVEKMRGEAPRARFIRNSKGDYIASDDVTMAMFSIYNHMQKLAAFDDEVGAANVNKWPRDVGISVRVEGGMENNAQYYGPADGMFFVNYTRSELPIPVNGGVIAHEHFHSLFYKLVPAAQNRSSSAHSLEGLRQQGVVLDVLTAPDETDKEADLLEDSREVYLGGLNEGFADFWGWVYTGDPDFIALSLPEYKTARSLKASQQSPDSVYNVDGVYYRLQNIKSFLEERSSSPVKMRMDYNLARTAFKYEVGSRFARVLKFLSNTVQAERRITDEEARRTVAKAVIQILPKLEFEKLGPELVLTSLATALPELKEKECGYLRNILQMADSTQTWSCAAENSVWSLRKEETK